MLENKWKDIAPEVPHDFHEKFEETLKSVSYTHLTLPTILTV